jgi:hypothetical protein
LVPFRPDWTVGQRQALNERAGAHAGGDSDEFFFGWNEQVLTMVYDEAEAK